MKLNKFWLSRSDYISISQHWTSLILDSVGGKEVLKDLESRKQPESQPEFNDKQPVSRPESNSKQPESRPESNGKQPESWPESNGKQLGSQPESNPIRSATNINNYSVWMLNTGIHFSLLHMLFSLLSHFPCITYLSWKYILKINYIVLLVPRCSSVQFSNARYNFPQMSDILAALWLVHSVPKGKDSVHKFLFTLRLHFPPNELSQFVPEIFNRVQIRWFSPSLTFSPEGSCWWRTSSPMDLVTLGRKLPHSLQSTVLSFWKLWLLCGQLCTACICKGS